MEMTDTWSHGSTLRWHSNPWPALRNSGDTVDAHQNRMLRLRRMLWPEAYPELDEAILTHDLAEVFTRDWSRPDKDAVPGLQAALDMADDAYLAWIGACHANLETMMRLKFLDRLDAYRWAVLHEPRCAPECEHARRGLLRDMEAMGMAGMEGVVFG